MDEELKTLLGEPPSISDVQVLQEVKQHAIADPASIRKFIERKARELAIAAGYNHVEPLVTWEDDPDAVETCGQFQAHVLSAVDMHVRLHFVTRIFDRWQSVWTRQQSRNQCQYFLGSRG